MNKFRLIFLLGVISPLCLYAYSYLSPYAYCAGNPVRYVDPSGCEIQGATKEDASMVVADFRAMFPGEVFADFRHLIVQTGAKQNGKSLSPITPDALSNAFNGIELNEDQQALVDLVVNTINSKDIHKVEYLNSNGNLSYSAEKVFVSLFNGLPTELILEANGGFPVVFIQNQGGGGLTTPIKKGTYSLIFKDTRYHLNGRAVTTGHEILGHGRSLALGRGEGAQHIDAIRTENLILRVMGIQYINNGSNHGPRIIIEQPSLLPSFR